MSFKKQYLKSKPLCKVVFSLPKQFVPAANTVQLIGDFNDWSMDATPMKHQKNGSFSATVELEPGREYQFRYFIDGMAWENDPQADRYTPNSYGADNSVIVV